MTTQTSKSRKIVRPRYYQLKLRSRADIVDFLTDEKRQRWYDHRRYLLTWNVKLYSLDLRFDHLFELHKPEMGKARLERYEADSAWQDKARAICEKKSDLLYEYATSDACASVNGSDSYKTLWAGESVEVEYEFVGRSGGYIALTSFNGFKLVNDEDVIEDMPFDELRKLYELVVMLDHDFTPTKACAEVEYQAAFALFENILEDLPVKALPGDDLGAGI